jgi:hypothetical protein
MHPVQKKFPTEVILYKEHYIQKNLYKKNFLHIKEFYFLLLFKLAIMSWSPVRPSISSRRTDCEKIEDKERKKERKKEKHFPYTPESTLLRGFDGMIALSEQKSNPKKIERNMAEMQLK